MVMAAGGIENARLLLASTADDARGLGNDRDLVGRFFMDHLSLETGLIVPAAQDLSVFDLYELPARRLNAGAARRADEGLPRVHGSTPCNGSAS